MQTVNLINYCEHIILSIPFTRLTYTHAHAHTQWQCCSLLHDVIMWQLQQSQWQKIKLEADPLGVGGGNVTPSFQCIRRFLCSESQHSLLIIAAAAALRYTDGLFPLNLPNP